MKSGNRPITIIDRREIEFDAKALISAIATSELTARRVGLPPSRPIGLRFRPEQGMIELLYEPGEKCGPIQMPATRLGAFLVGYGIRAHIPMPRLADKDIRVESDSIILCFKTRYAEVQAPDDVAGRSRFSRVRG